MTLSVLNFASTDTWLKRDSDRPRTNVLATDVAAQVYSTNAGIQTLAAAHSSHRQ